MILVSTGRTLVDLQGYAERALTLWRRLVSLAELWANSMGGVGGPALIMTGAAGTAALLLGICVILLLIRARREARKRREEIAIQIARAEAAEAGDAAKSEFLASLSHQIRTPLSAIVGFTDLALKTDLDPQLRESLDTVRTSADWLMYTVTDVLEFSRIEAGTVQLDNVPFSISECILSAMKIVEREAAARKLVTACKIEAELPQLVCGDPMRLRHVIFNLLDNAVRSTTSGSVMLSAALESQDKDGVVVHVAVRDTGIGIPPSKQPLIFEPFRLVEGSTAQKSRAPVLGLPISRRLVELMGGRLTFQSRLGAGTTFEFTARFQKHKMPELGTVLRPAESIEPQPVAVNEEPQLASEEHAFTACATSSPEATLDTGDSEFDLRAIWKDPIATCALDTAEADDHSHSSEDTAEIGQPRLSAAEGLELLQASCELSRELPSPAEPDDGRRPATAAAWDPFEQARRALTHSRFDVRVIHNNGDPSDRNLI